MRFNDGRCDRQGRFWAGSMLMDMAAGAPVGAMYRYNAGQTEPLTAQLQGFIVPNGLAFSPDGNTLYLSDSHPDVQKSGLLTTTPTAAPHTTAACSWI